jgi:hypothetical protein
MIRNLVHNFNPNRGWQCNSNWQFSPTHFKLNVPLLSSYDNTKYIIERVNITKHDIELYGRLIEEIKSEQKNKIVDIEYKNGKTGW